MKLLVILLLLMLIFGVGAVLEGLAWMFLIAVAFLVAAACAGYLYFGRASRGNRPSSSAP